MEVQFADSDSGSSIILTLTERPWSDDKDDDKSSQTGVDYRQVFDHCNYTTPQAESCMWKSSQIDDSGNMMATLQPNVLYEIRFYKIHEDASLLHNLPMTRTSTSHRERRSTSIEENRNSYTLPLVFRTPSKSIPSF